MDVKVLPDGSVLRISQDLGPSSKGCRLDPDALETAVGRVTANLASGADVLIVNKFGKHEAEGRGFRSAIADAISQDMLVLVGINALNFDAFQDFAGPDAVRLEPIKHDILTWIESAINIEKKVA